MSKEIHTKIINKDLSVVKDIKERIYSKLDIKYESKESKDEYNKMLIQAKKDMKKFTKFEDKLKYIVINYPSYKDKLVKDLDLL